MKKGNRLRNNVGGDPSKLHVVHKHDDFFPPSLSYWWYLFNFNPLKVLPYGILHEG
jgi:hypothetical protein